MEQYGRFIIDGVEYKTEGFPVVTGGYHEPPAETASVYAEANTADHWTAPVR